MAGIHVKKFNKIIKEFLAELINLLPEQKDISIFKGHISIVEMMNETKIIKSFIEHVYPYKKGILEKDEDFFLDQGNFKHENDYLSESIHLKELWKNNLSKENKEIVWKYFQVLIILSEKYIKKCGNQPKI